MEDLTQTRVKVRNGGTPPPGVSAVYSPEEFKVILHGECARVNRNSHKFSLVVFDTGASNSGDHAAPRLAAFLLGRKRATDQLGWLDENRLGITLPYCDVNGAKSFAKDVLRTQSVVSGVLNTSIYTYPSEQPFDEVLLSEFGGDSAGPSTVTAPGEYSPWVVHPGGNGRSHGREIAVETPSSAKPVKVPIHRIEALITRPIPRWKRALDIVGSMAGLILVSPLILLSAIFIKIVSPGPVFFRQERVGFLGKTFKLLKLRTMNVNADTSVHREHVKNLIKTNQGNGATTKMEKLDAKDSQIIPFGKILRFSCIDELPQLFNVLMGEMSLVGPRPCLEYEAQEYMLWNKERFHTVPGMTGLWQVNGKNNLTFEKMIRLDISYARNKSFWLDIKIILMTVPAIISEIGLGKSGKK